MIQRVHFICEDEGDNEEKSIKQVAATRTPCEMLEETNPVGRSISKAKDEQKCQENNKRLLAGFVCLVSTEKSLLNDPTALSAIVHRSVEQKDIHVRKEHQVNLQRKVSRKVDGVSPS